MMDEKYMYLIIIGAVFFIGLAGIILVMTSGEPVFGNANLGGQATAPPRPVKMAAYVDPTDCLQISGKDGSIRTKEATCPSGRVISEVQVGMCGDINSQISPAPNDWKPKSNNPYETIGVSTYISYYCPTDARPMYLYVKCCKIVYP